MGIKRHKPEEIVTKLRQVEVLVGQGMSRIDAIREVQNKSAAPLFDFLSAERDQLVAVQVTEVPAIKIARAARSWRTVVRAAHFNRLGVHRLHGLRIPRTRDSIVPLPAVAGLLSNGVMTATDPVPDLPDHMIIRSPSCERLAPRTSSDGVVEIPRSLQIVGAYSDVT